MIKRRETFDQWKKAVAKNWLIIVILLLAICTRMIALDRLPRGVLPDEAYGAYNAWGLMTEGLDSRGYRYPVYFVAWGSGMNALYSYLAIPMFWLLGVNILAYRLPQAIIGIISVYAMYRLGKELFDEKMGLLLAFALAINPWHIMNMRFGLESNMAPGMFVIGLLFLTLGMKKKSGYLIGAAVFLGAALYCYALTWVMIPLFLLLCAALFWKKIPKDRNTPSFIILLFFIALPLMLFVLINLGILGEIRTPFFSIPKLVGFRGGELNIAHLGDSFRRLCKVVWHQYDGNSLVANELTGAYYLFTGPFIVIGIACHVVSFLRNYKRGDNALSYLFLIWLVSAALMCALNEVISVVHINMIHIPIIFYGAFGIAKTAEHLKNKWVIPVCVAFWCFSFLMFLQGYVTTQSNSGYFVDERGPEALNRAKELAGEGGTVTIFDNTIIQYGCLLWYEKPLISDFSQNAVYGGNEAWALLLAYGPYRYIQNPADIKVEGLYIIRYDWAEHFEELGFALERVNDLYFIAVAL